MSVFIPPPQERVIRDSNIFYEIWYRVLNDMVTAINAPSLPSYTVTTLPSATTAGQMIYVSNESGGAVMAFSDGTNWLRVTDRAIVS
jgi:hypothetical protein